MRILRDTTNTLRHLHYENGTLTSGRTFTIGIVDEAGNTVVAAGTPTTDVGGGTGAYDYILTATNVPDVDILTATWTRTDSTPDEIYIDTFEVVGRHLVSEADVRAFDQSAIPESGSHVNYTDVQVAAARDEVTDLLEQWTGVSWAPRYHRHLVGGDGSRLLQLPHRQVNTIFTVTIGGTAQTVGNYTVDTVSGLLYSESGVFTNAPTNDPLNVVVDYEHGYEWSRNGVDHIALELIRDRLISTNIPDRARSWVTEMGTVQLVTEGGPMRNVSRLPEVNAWVEANRLLVPAW